MHQISALFLILLLFVFTGCEKKTTKHNTIPVENTTQVVGETSHTTVENNAFKVSTHKKSSSTTYQDSISLSDTFTLTDTKNRHFSVHLSNQHLTIKENTKPIVLITFFASWCPPCLYAIPYLNDLQKEYKTQLFLAGVLVHDTMQTSAVKSFIVTHGIKYYLFNGTQNNDFASLTAKTLHLSHNYPIPLSIMYVNGKYFTHYEGIVPIEMIEYDIEEAIKMLK